MEKYPYFNEEECNASTTAFSEGLQGNFVWVVWEERALWEECCFLRRRLAKDRWFFVVPVSAGSCVILGNLDRMVLMRNVFVIIALLVGAAGVHADLVESTLPKASPEAANGAPASAPAPVAAPQPAAAPAAGPQTPAPIPQSSWGTWMTQQWTQLTKPAAPPADSGPSETEQLRKEMSALRTEVKELSQTLDLLINRVMKDLEDENAQLRDEVRRAYATGAATTPQVPRPSDKLLDEVLSEPSTAPTPTAAEIAAAYGATPAQAKPPAPATPPPSVTFAYNVVQEWGRTPEAVAELGGNNSSLKGMVCVVPPGSPRTDLEQMGRDLRAKFEGYDNINVEVFDNEATAKTFVEQNKMNTSRRVLSVSKHQGSGRDVILYYENGTTYEVAR